jgi:hypothetical protein
VHTRADESGNAVAARVRPSLGGPGSASEFSALTKQHEGGTKVGDLLGAVGRAFQLVGDPLRGVMVERSIARTQAYGDLVERADCATGGHLPE